MIFSFIKKHFEEIKLKTMNILLDIQNNIHFYYLVQDLSKNNKDKIGAILIIKSMPLLF